LEGLVLEELKGKSYLTTTDLSTEGFKRLIDIALEGKQNPQIFGKPLLGKSVGLLFFNASLRTRASMAIAIHQLGGYPLILDVSKGVWNLETEDGAIMLGDRPEHIKEAIPVLSSYVDLIGVRCFSKLEDFKKDRTDPLIQKIAEYATVPLINLESAMHHPCQALSDMMTIKEKLGGVKGQKIVLTWAPHPNPLPMAVANSFALATSQLGADLWLANPEEYDLDPELVNNCKMLTEEAGGTLTQTHDQITAFKGAKIIYAKSWGALSYYGRWQEESPRREALSSWLVDNKKMAHTAEAWFMHCLPVRRNIVVSDEVIDGKNSCVIQEAENRLHGQRAVLAALMA
jgi:N-acetylornithine carbamoyltransferase